MNASNPQSVESSTALDRKRAPRWATSRRVMVVVGLSIYVISFFLLAASDFGRLTGPLHGYFCAMYALFSPLSEDGRPLLHENPIEYFSLLSSGLINPLFLTTLLLQLFRVRPQVIVFLRTLTVLIIPLTWIVFHHEGYYPREGYFLWMVGILLTLFAISQLPGKLPRVQHA